ncbi:MAG: prephenate dehydratase [Porticoccaceae bacterium]|jgi:chorismate mutase / prephenate dehydratase|nr:prephenate dehydratase [Porticoccaceae bacterium]
MSSDKELAKLRKKIDDLDDRLVQLISERASCASEVAEVKQGMEDTVYYRPEREAQVLRRIMEQNPGPLGDEEMARLFREVMSACLALEEPTKVAYLGPEGTFTQAAALKHFGHSSVTQPQSTIEQVFREVEAGACHYGVVPVENSTEGIVTHTLDSFINSGLRICGEVELRIHHNLMIGKNTQESGITRVYSHAQSLAQCRRWLDANYPSIEKVAVSSNAEAARRVQTEWNSAAIAGDIASELYDLNIIAENIEDHPDNSTRFLVIGSVDVGPSGKDKTSVMLSIKNRPGALFTLLEPFERNQVDMTRLESRPSLSENWNYVFFIDFIGHLSEPHIAAVFTELEGIGCDVKILGSYPVAVL